MEAQWIVVANASRARILQRAPDGSLSPLNAFEHPASRVRSHDLGDAPSGRAMSRRGNPAVPLDAGADAQGREQRAFAHELATFLEGAADRYDRLALLASSPFLGELKQALHDGARRRLVATAPVDLTAVELPELPERVEHHLASRA